MLIWAGVVTQSLCNTHTHTLNLSPSIFIYSLSSTWRTTTKQTNNPTSVTRLQLMNYSPRQTRDFSTQCLPQDFLTNPPPVCLLSYSRPMFVSVLSLLRSPGLSVAIFALHVGWEGRTEGGRWTGTQVRGWGRGEEAEFEQELGEPCLFKGGSGTVVWGVCGGGGSQLAGAVILRQHCKQTGGEAVRSPGSWEGCRYHPTCSCAARPSHLSKPSTYIYYLHYLIYSPGNVFPLPFLCRFDTHTLTTDQQRSRREQNLQI